MKSISLYVDKDTYLTRMHPFTKLCYIVTAIAASLITGKLWAFGIFIGISLVMLISGKIMKKVFPLIAFSFTILITIFLIHGLFNHDVCTPDQLQCFKYAAGICSVCAHDKTGRIGGRLGTGGIFAENRLRYQFRFSDPSADERNNECDYGCAAKPRT